MTLRLKAGNKFGANVAEGLVTQCKQLRLPLPLLEHRFHPVRKWKFDAAWQGPMVAVEIDGGVFMPGGGRHTRGAGYRRDCEKFAEAAILGWRVIRVLPEHVSNGAAIGWVERMLRG